MTEKAHFLGFNRWQDLKDVTQSMPALSNGIGLAKNNEHGMFKQNNNNNSLIASYSDPDNKVKLSSQRLPF